ncbi:MAG: glycosyltransferase [Betaproteobacteria bacterium]|nr:glycosyltransferase [Betaproteobacteria bacterium]
MRAVLATVGSRGDVQPMLALAQALARRGHTALLATPPNFAGWVRSHGFEHAPLGADIQAWLSDNARYLSGNPATMLRGMSRYFSEQIPVQFEQLGAILRGAEAVAIGGLALAAPSVAEASGIPRLMVAYTTCVLPSSDHPPPMIPWHGLPGWMNDLMWRAHHLFGNQLIAGAMNAGRARFGLPPVASLAEHFFRDTPIAIAADEPLFPADPAWQDRYPFAGFLFYDDPNALDPELDAWLGDGEPPVFAGFGSMSGDSIERVGEMLIEAVRATGRRCLIGAGWAGLGGGRLPPGWRVVREAPHALLFPRVAVVVHHGGSGTTANALRAGVPQVILPLILDQFHHAHRLRIAGLAPQAPAMERINARELTAAILAALALPPAPRAATAARLQASEAGATITAMLERMAASG